MTRPKETRQWILVKHPDAKIDIRETFTMRTAPLRELKEGEVLLKQLYLSLDPATRGVFMSAGARGYGATIPLGNPIPGASIGQVIETKNSAFKVGDRVESRLGWTEYGITVPQESQRVQDGVPSPLFLSLLGGTGLTGYFGVTDILKPKAGQVAVVSGAAGATGMAAAQILKILGCKVIAIAGSDEKCRFLKEQLGIDETINHAKYPAETIGQKFKELAPNGIDLYFDNTSGPILSAVIDNLAEFGRIALCGAISLYNSPNPKYPIDSFRLVMRSASMIGFRIHLYANQYPQARAQLSQWIREGKLKDQNTICEGFEKIPEHFVKLFEGANTGKLMVRLGEEEIRRSNL